MDVAIHVIRRLDYRGKSTAVSLDRPRLSFDALTTPGLLFAATCFFQVLPGCFVYLFGHQNHQSWLQVGCGLQVRGCKPELQLAAMQALEVFLEAALPADLDLDLLPRAAEGFCVE